MKRENFSNIGIVKQFKNGNINVKFDLSGIYKKESDIVNLLWLLDSIDTYNIGDEFCLSNYDCGCMLYDCCSDLVFIVSFTELSNAFQTGKTLKLYARTPDNYDREMIDAWYNE